MLIYPAIDLMGGKAVRLTKGDFDTAKTYGEDPVAVAESFSAAGAQHLHVIDLDGARQGSPAAVAVITDIVSRCNLQVQVGGGIRSVDHAKAYIEHGVDRIILGSIAVNDVTETARFFSEFGAERISLALDCLDCDTDHPVVAVQGWQEKSAMSLWQLIDTYKSHGLMHILCTDIDRDGTTQGANAQLYRRILDRHPSLKLQASGGVTALSELQQLARDGLSSCVIGKALYEGRFKLEDAYKVEGVLC